TAPTWGGGWPSYGVQPGQAANGGWYGAQQADPQAYANPYHQPHVPAHGAPSGPYPQAAPAATAPRRGPFIALALAAVVLAGVIGGAVGNSLAGGGRTGSSGVLDLPLPSVDQASAPPTPVEAVRARVLPTVVQPGLGGLHSPRAGP